MTVQRIKNKIVKEWFLSAQDDEKAIESMFQDKDWPGNTVCFLSQQMSEKLLKGFLVFSNIEPLKTHDLETLIKGCSKVEKDFLAILNAGKYLSGFYISTRYPGDYEHFSQKQAKEAFQRALEIRVLVFKKLSL